jgi:hypothetical protein
MDINVIDIGFELFIAIVFIIVLLKMLCPELFKPTPPTGVISGGLTYNGAPVVDAAITLYEADQITEIAVVTSDTNGKYVLPAEANGTYHITAILQNTDGTWLQADQDVVIDAPTVNVDLTLVNTKYQ